MNLEIKRFLKHIALLHQKNEEIRIAKGEKFNVFKLCKVNHYENSHSDIIAEFLNPNGSHGVGDVFLHLFCDMLNIDYDKSQKTSMWREYSISNGRLDILIKNNNKYIIIENKIYAAEVEDQLKKYNDWLKNNNFDGEIIFLTLDGHLALTGNGVKYKNISYACEIRQWIVNCIKEAVDIPFVREVLQQYLNLINDLTGNNLEEKYEEEMLKEIIGSKESFSASSLIYANFNKAKAQIIKNIMQKITPEDMIFSEKLSAARYSGVYYDSKDKDKPYRIEFQFQSPNFRDLCYGLTYKGDKLKCKKICIDDWSQSAAWFIWRWMDNEFKNWDDDFILYCYDDEDKITEKLKNCINELCKIIKNYNLDN